MSRHRRHYRQWLKGQGGCIRSFDLFEKYGLENCRIYLIENYPCNELGAREGCYILDIPCINKNVPHRTREEYRDAHKKEKQTYDKSYCDAHKEKIKQCRDAHKKEKLTYDKAYRNAHKEKNTSHINASVVDVIPIVVKVIIKKQ